VNTELVTHTSATRTARATRPARRVHKPAMVDPVTLRHGTAADAPALHALIETHLIEGHLLPRTLGELTTHASRFVVAVRGRGVRQHVVACAELAPLSADVAEVRSLVVDRSARSRGIGRRLLDELRRSAKRVGFSRLCAFTHDAAYFVRRGFSIVPHEWVPEKIARDCGECALFRRCGQHAMMLALRS
jgi:amino-acid N-acetyltransferase